MSLNGKSTGISINVKETNRSSRKRKYQIEVSIDTKLLESSDTLVAQKVVPNFKQTLKSNSLKAIESYISKTDTVVSEALRAVASKINIEDADFSEQVSSTNQN